MKKLRFQPTFASLTEAELEQLAHEVQRETYDAVRERVCKPRSEGGLDLHFTSNSPLVRLHNKKNRLDLINAQITSGQKLTLAQLDTFTAGQKRAPEEVHDAIMSATYVLVTEQDNTPHQLLALQRLADFPARAEYREQTAAIRAERLEISRSKENRAQEMHIHKIALDLRKQDHKEKSDAFAQQLALSRLNLNRNLFSSTPENEDQAIASAADDDEFDYENMPSISPNPLPPEVIAHNIAFSKKLRAGKIIIDHSGPYVRAVELPDTTSPTDSPPSNGRPAGARSAEILPVLPSSPTSTSPRALDFNDAEPSLQNHGRGAFHPRPTSISRDAIGNHGAIPAESTSTNAESPSTFKSDIKNQASEIDPALSTPVCEAHKQSSVLACSQPSTSVPEPLSFADLAAAVNRYTLRRAEEYVAHERNITPWLHRTPPPKFITQHRHCPCGNACPCPHHETPEKGGPFPEEFWSHSPFGFAYSNQLFARELPYRPPSEYLA